MMYTDREQGKDNKNGREESQTFHKNQRGQ